MVFTYTTSGVCSRSITVDISDDEVIQSVSYVGGCNGNLQGICKLVKGKKADDVIELLRDIKCGFKPTSCPAQLAKALEEYKSGKGELNV